MNADHVYLLVPDQGLVVMASSMRLITGRELVQAVAGNTQVGVG